MDGELQELAVVLRALVARELLHLHPVLRHHHRLVRLAEVLPQHAQRLLLLTRLLVRQALRHRLDAGLLGAARGLPPHLDQPPSC